METDRIEHGPWRSWCGELSMYPKLIVPVQIDLAIEAGRNLFGRAANPKPSV
jgi:hypothetical protein